MIGWKKLQKNHNSIQYSTFKLRQPSWLNRLIRCPRTSQRKIEKSEIRQRRAMFFWTNSNLSKLFSLSPIFRFLSPSFSYYFYCAFQLWFFYFIFFQPFVCQVLFGLALVLSNILMLQNFNKALQASRTTLEASIINTASNFVFTVSIVTKKQEYIL